MVKNSAFMYFQMGVRMLVGLYTVRVILKALGAEDYGIYNVVGGFVTMFSFITDTLVSASQRFFAFSIGKGEKDMLNRYFNSSLMCFLILSIILFFIIEIVGLWFVNYKMVVPDNRLDAANWVLQFAIIAFLIRILVVPYKAMVVSHEKMVIYAIISVADALLLLGIALLLQIVSADKLKVYSICMLGISLFTSISYILLCKSNFYNDSKIRIRLETIYIKEMMGYSGWYMFGTLAMMVRSQGINMVLNLFFGPIVNAARGIAFQINNALNQFVNSFYNAVRPQLTKLTAAENNSGMIALVYNSSIISFFLMCIVAVPLIIEMPFVLSLWLIDVPEHTIAFSRLVIITALIDTLGYPLSTAVCSLGKIKWYQIITGTILILNLPFSYILLRIYPNPNIAFYVSIVLATIVQMVRIVFMKRMFKMEVGEYIRNVLSPSFVVFFFSVMATYGICLFLDRGLFSHLLAIVMSVIFTVLLSYYVGLNKHQRISLRNLVMKNMNFNRNK